MSYFPMTIKYSKTDEVVTVKSVDEIKPCVGFKVIKTNNGKEIKISNE